MTKANMHKLFHSYLDLDFQVVGVKLFSDRKSFDSSNALQSENKLFYCHMVKKAGEGARRKADLSNFACETSAKMLGLESFYETEEGIDGWLDSGLYASRELAKQEHKSVLPVKENISGVEASPLSQIEVNPDVIIIIAKPYQAMRLVQGYTYHFGFKKDFQMSGMCGVCFESTALPITNNEFTVSLLCSGTRFVSQWPEEMMMVSFPFIMADKIVDGLIKTAKKCEPDEYKEKIENKLREDHIKTLDIDLKKERAYYYK